MFEKIWKLKNKLDDVSTQQANLVVMGDLNTMGLQFPRRLVSHTLLEGLNEIEGLEHLAKRASMKILQKQHDATWINNRIDSNLDHVIASNQMAFTNLGQRPDGTHYQVKVQGWMQLSEQERRDFVDNVSDHNALIVEIVPA